MQNSPEQTQTREGIQTNESRNDISLMKLRREIVLKGEGLGRGLLNLIKRNPRIDLSSEKAEYEKSKEKLEEWGHRNPEEKRASGNDEPQQTTEIESEFNVSSVTAKWDKETLERKKAELEAELATVSDVERGELTRRIFRVPSFEFYPDISEIAELIKESVQNNKDFPRVIDRVLENTTFLDPLKETGALGWILAGFPKTYELPNGTKIYRVDKSKWKGPTEKGNAGGHYDYMPHRIIYGYVFGPMKDFFLDEMLLGQLSPEVNTVQHEAVHSFQYPKYQFFSFHYPEHIDSKYQFFKYQYPKHIASELAEPFAYREGGKPIDIVSQEDLIETILEAKDKSGKPSYDIDQDPVAAYSRLQSTVDLTDKLMALYSIHPDFGPKRTIRQMGIIILEAALQGNNIHVLEMEIDRLAKELEVEPLGIFVEKYKLAQSIQRLGAQLVIIEELRKLDPEPLKRS